MQKIGFHNDKSIGDEDKESEDNEDDEKSKDDEWIDSESSNDFSKRGTVISKKVQYLYQYININTILPQPKSIH